MVDLIVAVVLGVIEGITEFLPISSTGHLIVAQRLLLFEDYKDVFAVVIQVGAIAAVLWFYRNDLINRVRGLLAHDPKALYFWKLLLIATIPAGILGLLLESTMERITTPAVVAWALIIGGIILWLVDRKPPGRKRLQEPEIDTVSTKQAWAVGIGQCLAIIPGVSRSGATIISGLASGLDRPTATAFSFYLSIPVLVLASLLKLVKHPDALTHITGGAAAIMLGLVAAFITALASIKWLLRYVSHHNFKPFAYYRIVAGILILIILGE